MFIRPIYGYLKFSSVSQSLKFSGNRYKNLSIVWLFYAVCSFIRQFCRIQINCSCKGTLLMILFLFYTKTYEKWQRLFTYLQLCIHTVCYICQLNNLSRILAQCASATWTSNIGLLNSASNFEFLQPNSKYDYHTKQTTKHENCSLIH